MASPTDMSARDAAPPVGAQRREPSPEALGAWRAFLEAHAAVMRRLEEALQAEQQLPLTWYDVLVQLSEAPGKQLRMSELAEAVVLSQSGLSRVVDRMQTAGLVERRRCETDARGYYAVLTEAGQERLTRAAPGHLHMVAEQFTDLLTDHEIGCLREALTRVRDANARR